MIDMQYEDMLDWIIDGGVQKQDRTGTGTKSLFGLQARFDLAEGFPICTTKRVPFRLVAAELLWMLSGNTNVKALQDQNCHIWDEWADENGDLGPVYGHQWRSWPENQGSIDQISEVIHAIKTNPDSRRLIVSAWNVADVPKMKLPPCHALFQFYIANNKLSCQLYQRSADMFLGVPFNIASYALLTHMIAAECDLDVGEFIWTGGDCHIYSNHVEQVNLQLKRFGKHMPRLTFEKKDFFSYRPEDFVLHGYDPHPPIKGDVAV